jgi:hypothetical protein
MPLDMSVHPFDLKNEDISRIKMLFPENKNINRLDGTKKPINIGSIYHGVELHVNPLFCLIL